MTPNDVKIVADNIYDFIEVPDGVSRLRKAVLTLAVSGNLVPQIANEGTTEELYKKIQVERKKKAGDRKKKVLDPLSISAEDIPFEIPKSWKWTRLNEIGQVIGGGTPSTTKSSYFTEPTDPGSVPWLSPADMRKQESMYVSHGRQNITTDGYKNSSATLMPAGSVIFSSRAPIGYVGIAINPLSTNQGFKSIVPDEGICSEYVYWYLRLRADDINARAPGTTFKEISGASFAKEVIALPPVSEQKRIAKKIEEVMKQLDELEVKKRERDHVRSRLARSAMQALGRGESKIAFEQLTELIKTSSDIKELENVLLTLAVSGKLVHQNKKEDAFDSLYATGEEIPFTVPTSWKWEPLKNIAELENGDRSKNYPSKIHRVDSGIPFINAGHIVAGRIDLSQMDYISNEKFESLRAGKISLGDILFCLRGSLGKCGLVTNIEKGAIASSLVILRLKKNVDANFILMLLQSNYTKDLISKVDNGTAQPNLSAKLLGNFAYPIPPLLEQKRIVKKVEEVTVLINRMKQVIG